MKNIKNHSSKTKRIITIIWVIITILGVYLGRPSSSSHFVHISGHFKSFIATVSDGPSNYICLTEENLSNSKNGCYVLMLTEALITRDDIKKIQPYDAIQLTLYQYPSFTRNKETIGIQSKGKVYLSISQSLMLYYCWYFLMIFLWLRASYTSLECIYSNEESILQGTTRLIVSVLFFYMTAQYNLIIVPLMFSCMFLMFFIADCLQFLFTRHKSTFK